MNGFTITQATDSIAHAALMMRAGQAEGMIPPDREPLTDGHLVIYANAPHQAVGCAAFFRPDGCDFLWLDILYVAPDYRRQGITKRLVRAVEDEARAESLGELRFGTINCNGPMIALAHALGYGLEDRIDFIKAVS